MITPSFSIEQSEGFLTFHIRAPYTKVSDAEIFVEDSEFRFYSKPYFLRLSLPGNLSEDGREEASYDADKGEFNVRIPKETEGEHFADLDMLSTLLAPINHQVKKPLIEVLDCQTNSSTPDAEDEWLDFDWQVEQNTVSDDTILPSDSCYGFANKVSSSVRNIHTELSEITDIKDPESISFNERSNARTLQELKDFDEEHYLADLYESEAIGCLLKFQPDWFGMNRVNIPNGEVTEAATSLVSNRTFTEEEKVQLVQLPHKEHLLTQTEKVTLVFGLIDIIFGYSYNHRTTEGENTVESAWLIRKLSPTLSWFDTHTSLKDCVTASVRRSLVYPFHRNFALSNQVLQDVIQILCLGKVAILKCLLQIQTLFSRSDPHFILNDLYITDYCIWIQYCDEQMIQSIRNGLEELKIEKCDLDLELDELEEAADLVLQDDQSSDVNDEPDTSNNTISDEQDTVNDKSLVQEMNKMKLSCS